MTIRVGVIGAGVMGSDHARLLDLEIPGADVVFVADVDLARASAVAATLSKATATNDPFYVIASDQVDALVIASTDDTHATYVNACLDAAKPVLCEKPLAPTASECLQVARRETAVVRGNSNLVSVGFMRRFDPAYVELKQMIIDGSLGVPLLIHSVGRGVSAPPGSDELSITGSAIHDLDVIPWLLDSPITAVCWTAPRQSPAVRDRQDPQFVLVRTADGALGTVEIFLNATYGYDIRCEVVGSEATSSITEPTHTVVDASRQRTTAYAGDWRRRFEEAYRLQDRAWIKALANGESSPLASANDGLTAALVAEAVIRSMHSGGAWIPVSHS